ncbi:putative site-specific recombinase in afa region, partial [human gut metagenome]
VNHATALPLRTKTGFVTLTGISRLRICTIAVSAHTFRHSHIMHMLYHRQPRKVIQALAGHRDPRSMEVYTRVFALDMAATLAVP